MGISTHVLETASGRPAAGVAVCLERVQDVQSAVVARGATDADGRVAGLVDDASLEAGSWRLTFATGQWYAERGLQSFHPHVSIDFQVHDAGEHYHVPLLLTPWSYSTYRGS